MYNPSPETRINQVSAMLGRELTADEIIEYGIYDTAYPPRTFWNAKLKLASAQHYARWQRGEENSPISWGEKIAKECN